MTIEQERQVRQERIAYVKAHPEMSLDELAQGLLPFYSRSTILQDIRRTAERIRDGKYNKKHA